MPPRPDRLPQRDYIPLTTLTVPTSPSPQLNLKAADYANTYVLRRRVLYALLFSSALATLFFLLKVQLRDIDAELGDIDLDLDLDYLDYPQDAVESGGTSYLPFHVPSRSSAPRMKLKPILELPPSCIETYFTNGSPCYAPHVPKLDLLWTWVNGSDPLLEQAKKDAIASYKPGDPWRPAISGTQARLYRDHDELRHSLRSVLAAFRAHTKRFFLLTSDFPVPVTTPALNLSAPSVPTPSPSPDLNSLARRSPSPPVTGAPPYRAPEPPETPDSELDSEPSHNSASTHPAVDGWRLGQLPQWLDFATQNPNKTLQTHGRAVWYDGQVQLAVVHHAQVFEGYAGTSFNSLAIESQLGNVDGISENFIYMNDDLYMATPMTPASFYTSAYGIVVHLQSNLVVAPTRPTVKTQGEWRSMGESNYMLSQRFGRRARPYVVHEAKTVSRPLLQEINTLWSDAFARSSEHPFRETAGPGSPADINTMFLHAHFVVERAREAMLWAWVVGRMGGLDDWWSEREGRAAWEALGGTWDVRAGEKRELGVRAGRRATLEKDRVEKTLSQSGVTEGLGKTSYVFSSLDGYPYADLGTRGQPSFPSSTPDIPEHRLRVCRISYEQCFAGHSKASEVFKNLAFRELQCGDCVLTALVKNSGTLGISAILPPPDRTLGSLAGKLLSPILSGAADVPHLPLVERWEDGDFSLREVMGASGERNVRAWTLNLLQRYRYVLGSTPSVFERLQSPKQAVSVLQKIDKNKDAALLCINDDVVNGDAQVAATFRDWQERRWGRPAAWEKL